MIIYLIVYLVVLSLMFCYQKSSNFAQSFLCLYSAFILLFLFQAVRFDTGVDYRSYYNTVNDFIINKNAPLNYEVGWVILLGIMRRFVIPVQFFFIVTSFVTLLLFFKIIPKNNAVLAMASYLSIAYLESFSLVRQCLAISIVGYSIYKYFKIQKIIPLLLGIVIAGLFHNSAFFLIPFILIFYQTKIVINTKHYFLIFISLYCIFTLFNIPILLLKTVVGKSSYSVYLNLPDIINKTDLNTGLGMLLRYIIIIICYYNPRYSFKLDKLTVKQTNFKALFLILLFIFFLFSTQISIFVRLPCLITPLFPLFFYSRKIRILRYQKIQSYILVILFSCLYVITLIKSSKSEVGWFLVPYESVFLKGVKYF